jgi:hypothetical protein
MLTVDTITDDQIRELREDASRRPRQNAYTRAIQKDCNGALDGSRACRASAAYFWNAWRLPASKKRSP